MMPGCQTLKSKFSDMKLPSADKLAFWKQDDAAIPPPPARHFDPAPTNSISGNERTMVASNDVKAGSVDLDAIRNKIDSKYENARNSIASNGDDKFRRPFGVDSSGASMSGQSSFISATEGFRSAANDFQKSGSATLNEAQNQFNAAIAGVKESTSGFKSPAETLSKSADEGFQGLKNSAQSKFDSSLAKVNKSLYDSQGNLTTKASNAFKGAQEKLNQTIGSVAANAKGAKDKFASAASGFKVPAFKPADSTTDNGFKKPGGIGAAVSKVSQKASDLLAKATDTAKEAASGFDYPAGAPGIGQTKNEITPAAPGQNMLTQNQVAANSFQQPSAVSTQSTLNQPAANTGSTNGLPSNGSLFKAPGSDAFGGTRVANVTPAPPANGSMLGPQKPGAPAASNSAFGSTWNRPIGQTGAVAVAPPTQNPGNGLRTASIPSNFSPGQNATTSHESDVELPSKLLTGSGGYAPGSVSLIR
jgi:hypothetical protein